MRFTVGGEEYDLNRERIVAAMRGVSSEPIVKHLVEIDGVAFPPKQVFATVTSRPRTSFTTMEAQRVLRRLGFACRPATPSATDDSLAAATTGPEGAPAFGQDSVEARIATLEAAIAGLHARVSALEH
jgi:hypothetical protein